MARHSCCGIRRRERIFSLASPNPVEELDGCKLYTHKDASAGIFCGFPTQRITDTPARRRCLRERLWVAQRFSAAIEPDNKIGFSRRGKGFASEHGFSHPPTRLPKSLSSRRRRDLQFPAPSLAKAQLQEPGLNEVEGCR